MSTLFIRSRTRPGGSEKRRGANTPAEPRVERGRLPAFLSHATLAEHSIEILHLNFGPECDVIPQGDLPYHLQLVVFFLFH